MDNMITSAEQNLGLTSKEMESVKEFFDEEIRGHDGESVLRIYQQLLKDVQNRELKHILIDRITKERGNSFEFFHEFVLRFFIDNHQNGCEIFTSIGIRKFFLTDFLFINQGLKISLGII